MILAGPMMPAKSTKETSYALPQFTIVINFAFPDGEDLPNEAAERCGVVFVAGGIAFKLLLPPGALGFWDSGGFAVPV